MEVISVMITLFGAYHAFVAAIASDGDKETAKAMLRGFWLGED